MPVSKPQVGTCTCTAFVVGGSFTRCVADLRHVSGFCVVWGEVSDVGDFCSDKSSNNRFARGISGLASRRGHCDLGAERSEHQAHFSKAVNVA